MQRLPAEPRVRRRGLAVAALTGFVAISLPVAAAMAQSRNIVNSWDVDPNYHMNFMSNPCSLGYWNQNLTCAPGGYENGYNYGYPGYPGSPAYGYPW
jgi:hypothetical protein